ncbi:MAG TPA: HAMP domain-containing methyl-accepting chemotaxis protein [Stellaceae bacterium]|nr:HAMP domain-containing methyl-accepting chemotaxis protein [Stellaceae bacterium]
MLALNRFRIKVRINLGFGVLIAVALLMAAVGAWELTTIGREVGGLWSVSESASSNQQVVALAERMRRLALRLKADWDETTLAQYKEAHEKAEELLTAAASATLSDERRRIYAGTVAALAEQQTAFDRLAGLVASMKQDRASLFKVGDEVSASVASLVDAAWTDGSPDVIARATAVDSAVLTVQVANWRFLATSDPKGIATFNDNLAKAGAAAQGLQDMTGVGLVRPLLAPVNASLGAYGTSFGALAQAMLAADELYEKQLRTASDKIDTLNESARRSLATELATTKAETDGVISGTLVTEAVIAGLGLLLGAALAFLVGRGIAVPIAGMTQAMARLAGGDTSLEIPGRDDRSEIGEMAAAVDVFKESMIRSDALAAEQKAEEARKQRRHAAIEAHIAEFDRAVHRSLEVLMSASAEMNATSHGMSATAEQTSRQATAVAAASNQASANVQTVATASEEISASISEISRQVAQSTEIARKAVEEAQRTGGTMHDLAAAAQKIGVVVELIQDIASQTNLLALNATIEAARAGEAGKGFAVVASEVKSLATETGKATEDIAAEIAAIQSAAQRAVEAIEGIDATIGRISEISTGIASAMEEQGAATHEIARNTQEAAKGTHEVSKTIAAVNQAAADTGAAAQQVSDSSSALGKQAETLRADVEAFLDKIRAA